MCSSPDTNVKNEGQRHGALEEIGALFYLIQYFNVPIFYLVSVTLPSLLKKKKKKAHPLLPRIKICYSYDEASC